MRLSHPLLALGLLSATLAQASPVYQVSGIVNTHVHSFSTLPYQTDVGYQDFNYLNQPQARGVVQIEDQAHVAGGGTAFGRVSAQPGVLKAWSWSTHPAWTEGRSPYDHAASEIRSTFADTILVQGAGLAVGTPVQYRLSFRIEGSTSLPVFEMGGALAASVSADVRLRDLTGATVGMGWDSNRDDEGWYTMLLDTEVGSELLLSGGLSATTYVTAVARNRFAEADYGRSSYFYLTPSVAGLNTVGASGHDFTLPDTGGNTVPVPATLGLALGGLMALGLARVAARSGRGIQRGQPFGGADVGPGAVPALGAQPA